MLKKHIGEKEIKTALWALVLFICGYIVKKIDSPDEVKIVNFPQRRDTVFVQYDDRIINQNREKITNYKNDSSFLKKNPNSINSEIGTEVQISSLGTETGLSDTRICNPKFILPSITKGWVAKKINSFANVKLSNTKISKNDKINIDLNFLDKNLLPNITPIFVSLEGVNSSKEHYTIWDEQYIINKQKSNISFFADFNPGKYYLVIGFYLKSGINTKYPEFYSKSINVEITP